MKQEPVAWAEITKEYVAVSDEPFENAIPLYAAPVHAIDISQKRVDEMAKRKHDEDWYGQHQWQSGYDHGWDKAWEGIDEREKRAWDAGYEHAKSNREWVGLTDEEMKAAMEYWSDPARSTYGGAKMADGEYVNIIDTWRYIEAKLKEKNN